jgi:hypothetical protein
VTIEQQQHPAAGGIRQSCQVVKDCRAHRPEYSIRKSGFMVALLAVFVNGKQGSENRSVSRRSDERMIRRAVRSHSFPLEFSPRQNHCQTSLADPGNNMKFSGEKVSPPTLRDGMWIASAASGASARVGSRNFL